MYRQGKAVTQVSMLTVQYESYQRYSINKLKSTNLNFRTKTLIRLGTAVKAYLFKGPTFHSFVE